MSHPIVFLMDPRKLGVFTIWYVMAYYGRSSTFDIGESTIVVCKNYGVSCVLCVAWFSCWDIGKLTAHNVRTIQNKNSSFAWRGKAHYHLRRSESWCSQTCKSLITPRFRNYIVALNKYGTKVDTVLVNHVGSKAVRIRVRLGSIYNYISVQCCAKCRLKIETMWSP